MPPIGLGDFRELNPGHPCVLFAEVVTRIMTQMGIEPMTTRCLVVALTTKLLGHPPLQRPVRWTSDQSCGFSRRTTGVVLRAEASGGVLERTPRARAYASGAGRPPQRFLVWCSNFPLVVLRARWLKKVERQRVCCKPMAQRDVELDGASREIASGAS